MTLSENFRIGQELFNQIENNNPSSSDTTYQDQIKDAISHFSKCLVMVNQLKLFSSNETIEDINTGDLRFLLLEAYIGDLTVKLTIGNRSEILNIAKSHLEQFLRNLEVHKFLKDMDRQYIEDQFSGVKKDPAKKREEKIARYKREKETKAKVEALHQQLSSRRDKGKSKDEDDYDDINRDYVLTLIDLFTQKSIESLILINQELDLLNNMKKIQEQKNYNESSTSSLNDDNKIEEISRNNEGPLLSKEGKPLRSFIITNQREEILQKVFRPGWRLPTMTIDEYLQKEAERGNIISGGGNMPEKKEIDDDDEQAVNAETYKAREWDEFKDANPRGSGNQMGKG
ncbi:2559_t:CDS:2 [Entrophospora sp. SA101]|nr:11831_t:CDS:2 [Entrophospora sp. SA101]CAJ0638585.1 2559_t:CDS:2 [Entrophospora sp. SA101]CAJ0827130.1 8678_t:CDS:2 [Entrophospora sp. SA101]CAJ0832819.1 5784_t:CDS:2 [Entrophospora sp. SA101]